MRRLVVVATFLVFVSGFALADPCSIPTGTTTLSDSGPESVVVTCAGFAFTPGTIFFVEPGTVNIGGVQFVHVSDILSITASGLVFTSDSETGGFLLPVGVPGTVTEGGSYTATGTSTTGGQVRIVVHSDLETSGTASDTLTVVPEPSGLALLGTGFVGIGAVVKKRWKLGTS